MDANKQIRVLHILPSLGLRGGMVNVVSNYQRYIDDDVVHFDYLYFGKLETTIESELRRRGSKTWLVPLIDRRAQKSFFEEHHGEFDIVHCHPIYAAQLLGRLAIQNGAKRVIAHSHSTKYSEKRISALRNRFLALFVGKCATDFVACTAQAAKLHGRYARSAYIMHNAIDFERFSFSKSARESIRDELGVSDDTLVLGSVGRLSEEKNQAFMIDVLQSVRARGVPCVLVIAGSGVERDALESKAQSLGQANHFIMLGDRSDVEALYSAYDCFILSSLFEGLPVSAVEAQAAGLPCVLSDAITKEVAFGCVRFCPLSGSPDDWASAVIQMSGNRYDLTSEEIANSGFDIRLASQDLVQFYRGILLRPEKSR